MATEFTLKDFELADSELRAAQSRRHFYIHTFLYVVTNAVLVVLNLMLATAFHGQSSPSYYGVLLWERITC